MTDEGLASHRVAPYSVDRALAGLRRVIAELDLERLETEVGFSLTEPLHFFRTEIGPRYPLSFGDPREFLLQLAESMTQSEVGTFLLCAQGCDWRTTDLFFDKQHRTLLQQRLQDRTLPLFDYLLFFAFPGWLATQERFTTFQQLTQPSVIDGAVLASLPCGRMRDLLTLGYRHVTTPVHLIGIDKDPDALVGAEELARSIPDATRHWRLDYRLGDAFRRGFTEPPIHKGLDLLTSNGLNIYVTAAECQVFYANAFDAIKPGGVFITSHLVPPSEYRWNHITRGHWQLQVLAWNVLIHPRWESFLKPTHLVRSQLEEAGFVDVEVLPDWQGVYPSFTARKPS